VIRDRTGGWLPAGSHYHEKNLNNERPSIHFGRSFLQPLVFEPLKKPRRPPARLFCMGTA
jgi:hypothetical protein